MDEESNEILYAVNAAAAEVFQKMLQAPEGRSALSYIKNRGLTDETLEKFQVGYAPASPALKQTFLQKGFSEEDLIASGLYGSDEQGVWFRFKDRLMFPIFDPMGRVIGFSGRVMDDREPKYKNTPETAIFKKRSNLFAFDKAVWSCKSYLILCEGQMDVISMHQAGFTNAVASLGTALTEAQAALIKTTAYRVVLLYDTDGPGKKATQRAISILESAGVLTYICNTLPYKDPDEMIQAGQKEALHERLRHPMPADEYLVREALFDGGKPDFSTAVNVLLHDCTHDRAAKVVRTIVNNL